MDPVERQHLSILVEDLSPGDRRVARLALGLLLSEGPLLSLDQLHPAALSQHRQETGCYPEEHQSGEELSRSRGEVLLPFGGRGVRGQPQK